MKSKGQDGNKNLMAATWTKAAKVRRQFKAGRPRQTEVRYDAERAIIEGRIMSLNIRQAMVQSGVYTTAQDLKVGTVMMSEEDPGTLCVLKIPMAFEDLPRAYGEAAHLEANGYAPLGICVWQRDREAEHDGAVAAETWIQQWLIDARAAKASIEARKAFLDSGGETVEVSF